MYISNVKNDNKYRSFLVFVTKGRFGSELR